MAQYIPKDALVVEIDRLENKLYYEPENFKDVGAKMALDSLKSFLDTTEAKEVDLDEEIKSYFKGFGKFPSVGIDDCIDIAKHFFELGLAQKGERV